MNDPKILEIRDYPIKDMPKNKCPRRGRVWLTEKGTKNRITLATSCKTRACPVCGPKVRAKFEMLVEHGLRSLTSSRSYFITLTFVAEKGKMRNAQYVATKWRILLSKWAKMYPNLAWVKVVELTMRNQPHLHLIVASEGYLGSELTRCVSKKYKDTKAGHARWMRNLSSGCPCCMCQMSRLWKEITGDSHIVDVQDTSAEMGGASYISKYFGKDLLGDKKRKELGFARSWSRSRNWPVMTPELLATYQRRWAYVEAGAIPKEFLEEVPYEPGLDPGDIRANAMAYWIKKTEENADGLLDYVGTDLTFDLKESRIKKAKETRYRRLIGANY